MDALQCGLVFAPNLLVANFLHLFRNSRVLLTEPPMNPTKNREQIIQVDFPQTVQYRLTITNLAIS